MKGLHISSPVPVPVPVHAVASRDHRLRGLSVVETCDKVILQGQMPSFYLKQMAQEIAKRLAPGKVIVNEICVVYIG